MAGWRNVEEEVCKSLLIVGNELFDGQQGNVTRK